VNEMISELVQTACSEVACTTSLNWRAEAFMLMQNLYFLPTGKIQLGKLGHAGGRLEVLAREAFEE
jgi:hypothetical protein